MKKRLLVLAILLFSFSIFATDVFINNVKIDPTQMQNLEMKNCTVSFDTKGNVHIKAPGIKLVQENATPQKDYFLTISVAPAAKNMLTIFINGSKVFDIAPGNTDLLEKVSSYLHSGNNTILIVGKPETVPTTVNFMFGTGKEEKGKLALTPVETKKVTYDKNGLSLTVSLKVE